jgi:acyl carrier protein
MTDTSRTPEARFRAEHEIEEMICKFVAERLAPSPACIDAGTNLRQLPGIDSLDILELTAELEHRFAIAIDGRKLVHALTVRDLVAVVVSSEGFVRADESKEDDHGTGAAKNLGKLTTK